MTKEKIELPIEWVKRLDKYIQDVEDLEPDYADMHKTLAV